MKKMLFMLSSMNIGGVEKSFLSLLSTVPKDKYDITLLLLEKKGGFLKYVPDWIKVIEAPWFIHIKPIIMQPPQETLKSYLNKKEFYKIPVFLYVYVLSEKLLKNRYLFYKHVLKTVPILEEDYDVAISYQGPTDTIDYYIANKVEAKRKISWVHFDVTQHMINEELYKRLYQKIDKVFVVSKEAKKKLVQKIPSILDKAEVFMNIISEDLITSLSKKEVAFDENYQGFKVVTVGRLSKEKGQDLAIKALAKLRSEGYQVRWYCIGEGNHRKEYEQLIESYGLKRDFILMGSLANPYPYIARANIYVQTSRHEGFCLTLAEARCLKKPIITTNFISAKDQIIDGYNGLIADLSAEDLYEKIKLLIEEELMRKTLVENLSTYHVDTSKEVSKLLNYLE